MNGLESALRFIVVFFLLNTIFSPTVYSQDPSQSLINVSKITSWVTEEGFHDWVIGNNEFNGSYPNGLPVGVIFSEGIVWGGLVYDGQDQKVRVNGNTFGTGCSPITRLCRVRTDYYKADLTTDAASFLIKDRSKITDEDIQQIKNQYEKDWNEWPADKGAPYFDIDKDGKYDPDVDVPGVPGALQTLWINYNDDLSESNYGSIPIGLEIQETHWAYTNRDPIGNVIYKKIDIIYKGTSTSSPDSRIDSMYICQWSDTDLGNSSDDFIGCDTTLNLGYTYNSTDPDAKYGNFGLAPPAVGYSYLQGVSKYTGDLLDSAVFNFRWRRGFKYFNSKPLTVAILHRTGDYFTDPSFNYNGTLEFYNMMGGYLPYPLYPFQIVGMEFIGYGTYMLPGDPVTGTGEIDGLANPAGDRRMMLMTGPFSMNLDDTVEVVNVLVGGMGVDHFDSITELRKNTRAATLFYNYFVEDMTARTIQVSPPDRHPTNIIPDNYVLYQNYPNPFNSYTIINYELPEEAFVRLIIYDVLGKEVKRLVNEEKSAGKYTIQFDADNLSSGVYFYKISFENNSNKMVFDGLYKTMKLILLK
jgi:hypothetical protein